jgi:hypothetical protein
MASQAGLWLAGRYAEWDRHLFTSASNGHVSVNQRADHCYQRCASKTRPKMIA